MMAQDLEKANRIMDEERIQKLMFGNSSITMGGKKRLNNPSTWSTGQLM